MCTGVATDYVAVRYKGLHLISVYFSPNLRIGDFEEFLSDLGDYLRIIRGEVIIGGDFNAKSMAWGCNYTDRRGEILINWAAETDLRLQNIGDTPTCTRPQGTSVVDITWTRLHESSRIGDWQVSGKETMSDHAYVTFVYRGGGREMGNQW